VKRLVLVAFFLETGFILVVAPWSAYWDRNYFGTLSPQLHAFVTNNFIRGAVSGLGVINIALGIADLVSLFLTRHSRDDSISVASSRAAEE